MLRKLLLLGMLVLLAGCAGNEVGDEPPVIVEPSDEACGIESCHGLDIVCGSNVPEVCTMEYRLGDFCREFAECEVIEGQCQFMENSTFFACKECVETCEDPDDPEGALECEDVCRQQFSGGV